MLLFSSCFFFFLLLFFYSNAITDRVDPHPYGIGNPSTMQQAVENHVRCEKALICSFSVAGKAPCLLVSEAQRQTPTQPYSEGYVYYLAMTRLPGEEIDDIKNELSVRELQSIKRQLAKILEEMRPHNMYLFAEDTSCLQYDRDNDKLYVQFFPPAASINLSLYLISWTDNRVGTCLTSTRAIGQWTTSSSLRTVQMWRHSTFR